MIDINKGMYWQKNVTLFRTPKNLFNEIVCFQLTIDNIINYFCKLQPFKNSWAKMVQMKMKDIEINLEEKENVAN